MADIIADQPVVVDNSAQQAEFKAALDEQMALSLGNGIIPEAQPQPATQDQPSTEQPAAQVAVVDEPLKIPFESFQKFGYQKPEDILADIEAYQKSKGEVGKEFEFADDASAELFKAFTLGDKKAVREYLERESRIENLATLEVNKDTAADIVKFGMQLKFPTLTQQEIEYKYNRQFSIPAKPIQGVDEDPDDYQARMGQWQDQANDRQMELMIEAKMIKPDIEAAKKQLALPKYIPPVDEGYAQYQKMLAEEAQLQQEAQAIYKNFTPQQLETKLKFTDEANKIAFEFQHVPDEKSFTKAVEIVNDDKQFWGLFKNSDGSWNHSKLLDTVLYAINKEATLMSAMNQAKNAAIKAQLPDNSKESGMLRQMPQSQETVNELDANMKRALHGFM